MSGATAATATTAAVGATAAESAFAASAVAASGVGAATTSAFSLGSLASYASLASAGIGALGSIEQSRASAASAGYNAKVQAQNAQIQTQNANFAGAEGEQNVGAEGAKNKAAIAATLANQGASGVDVNSGSSVDTRESEAKVGMLNALNIRSQAARSAYGYQTGAASDLAQSQLLRKQQQSDITGGYLNAGATVLGGVGQAAKYTDWLNQGGI